MTRRQFSHFESSAKITDIPVSGSVVSYNISLKMAENTMQYGKLRADRCPYIYNIVTAGLSRFCISSSNHSKSEYKQSSTGPSLGEIQPAVPHERSPYAPKLEVGSHEETDM